MLRWLLESTVCNRHMAGAAMSPEFRVPPALRLTALGGECMVLDQQGKGSRIPPAILTALPLPYGMAPRRQPVSQARSREKPGSFWKIQSLPLHSPTKQPFLNCCHLSRTYSWSVWTSSASLESPCHSCSPQTPPKHLF